VALAKAFAGVGVDGRSRIALWIIFEPMRAVEADRWRGRAAAGSHEAVLTHARGEIFDDGPAVAIAMF